MRCMACDVILSEKEDAATFTESGTRISLCKFCSVDLPKDLVNHPEDEDWDDPQETEPSLDEEDPYDETSWDS